MSILFVLTIECVWFCSLYIPLGASSVYSSTAFQQTNSGKEYERIFKESLHLKS